MCLQFNFPDNNGITTIYHSLPFSCSTVNGFTKNEMVDVKTFAKIQFCIYQILSSQDVGRHQS